MPDSMSISSSEYAINQFGYFDVLVSKSFGVDSDFVVCERAGHRLRILV
jgi:hypothetical protein